MKERITEAPKQFISKLKHISSKNSNSVLNKVTDDKKKEQHRFNSTSTADSTELNEIMRYRSKSVSNVYAEQLYEDGIRRNYSDDTNVGRQFVRRDSPMAPDFNSALKRRAAILNNNTKNTQVEIYDPSIISIESFRCKYLYQSKQKELSTSGSDQCSSRGKLLLLHNEIMFICSGLPSRVCLKIEYKDIKSIKSIDRLQHHSKILQIELFDRDETYLFTHFLIPILAVKYLTKHIVRKYSKYQNIDLSPPNLCSNTPTDVPVISEQVVKADEPQTEQPANTVQRKKQQLKKESSESSLKKPAMNSVEYPIKDAKLEIYDSQSITDQILMSKNTVFISLFLIVTLIIFIIVGFIRLSELQYEINNYASFS